MVFTRAEQSATSNSPVTNGVKEDKDLKKLKQSKASPTAPRRSSARIQALQKAEKTVAGPNAVVVKGEDKCEDNVKEGKGKKRSRKSGPVDSLVVEEQSVLLLKKKPLACGKDEMKVENAVGQFEDKSDTVKVKDTIRLFNKYYLQLVQEEEKRCVRVETQPKDANSPKKSSQKASKSKKGAPHVDSKKPAKRPDLKAISKASENSSAFFYLMMENNEILYSEKRIGSIPGIEVGYQFYSRAEMVAVGFHSHWLNGIDYMGQSYAKAYSFEFPIAIAIVLSGMYEDDQDNAEDVVYTGQGGHNLTGDKRQIQDQKLERGNLALKNCVEQCVPVRVIRGHDSSSSYSGKVYTYDGLYKPIQGGKSSLAKRRRDFPHRVYFTYGRVPQSIAEIRGLVCEDITGGFTYCKSLKVAKNVKLPSNAAGCKCKGLCNDPTTCACALRNGSDFPYVSRNGGRLVEAKDVVFECGPKCGCGPGCVNRTSQKGLRYRLEVFRTAKKGWAVRSWDFIPSGAPVCEYTGILARTEDMDSMLENNYIFEIDGLQTIKGLGGRERRSQDGEIPEDILNKYEDPSSESVPEFCIDAGSTGNIARFINHCCEPNLFVQCVLSTHDDLRLARVMLFAADNIPPLQELTYDYGYALDSVLGSDGKIKQMPCYCGAADCRKRLF
ncbi:hypothetical protein V8G54_018594 [Vigna mungo]|uniref:Histone-lysine N-methyltransferase, H3 lysine-9 specific SUVH4 n=1 Tax=Vigna mungo TaxID=3915 RepID=A0AAQ3NB15_VIGMU